MYPKPNGGSCIIIFGYVVVYVSHKYVMFHVLNMCIYTITLFPQDPYH